MEEEQTFRKSIRCTQFAVLSVAKSKLFLSEGTAMYLTIRTTHSDCKFRSSKFQRQYTQFFNLHTECRVQLHFLELQLWCECKQFHQGNDPREDYKADRTCLLKSFPILKPGVGIYRKSPLQSGPPTALDIASALLAFRKTAPTEFCDLPIE